MKFFIQHTLFAFDRQMLLADLIEDFPWTYDLQSGILSFGDQFSWEAEVLGTESDVSSTWLWSWANPANNIPSDRQKVSLKLKSFGEMHGVYELAEPLVQLDKSDGHAFASFAVGEGFGKAYYRGAYEGGALFLIITDERLKLPVEYPLQRILTVFPQAISAIELEDHREALRCYMKHYGFAPEDEERDLVLRDHDEEVLRATFDHHGRLRYLKGKLQP